ncbi:MAG: L,D-transpeptidase [Candidatus Goldbacteria bacterium]|nr:L,D-transpeptidase [Candidatus Goldiibacteriota bacterium]
MNKIICFLFIFFIFYIQNIQSFDNKKLKSILKNYKKKYFIYINKSQKKLYLVDKNIKVWRNYIISVGKNEGQKLYRGDLKTPEGVYYIDEIYQYEEPWYLKRLKTKMESMDKKSKIYRIYKKYYDELEKKYIKNKNKLEKLNSTYLRAEDGFKKFKTGESLGYNSFGPVFMLLDYPNEEDYERYKEALDEGLIKRDKNLYFKDPGDGIAIHGTNDEDGLGYNSSAGCIRMKNKDIIELSNYVMEGTMVIIE